MRNAFGCLLVALTLLTGPAAAAGSVPVEVIGLRVAALDTGYSNCISFINVSDRPIESIEFAFTHVDEFGETKGRVVGLRTGTFSPGVKIEGPTPNVITERSKKNCWPERIETFSLGSVQVAVLHVTYADGTQWSSDTDAGKPLAISPIDYPSLGLPNDMQQVAVDRGKPCHVSILDSLGGSVQVWSYDCATDAETGKEKYYFLNGRLVQHVSA